MNFLSKQRTVLFCTLGVVVALSALGPLLGALWRSWEAIGPLLERSRFWGSTLVPCWALQVPILELLLEHLGCYSCSTFGRSSTGF